MKLRCSAVWIIAALLWNTTFKTPSVTLFVSHHNLFETSFTQPYEIIFFVFSDGDVYGFTTKHESCVLVSGSHLIKYMKDEGKGIEDLVIVIHNHLTSPIFSAADKRFCVMLRQLGYDGAFLLYHCPTGKIKVLED